MEKRKRFRA